MAEAVISNHALPISDSEEAVAYLIRVHARLVYRIAYSVLRNHEEAEDATQEVFMRVLRHRADLKSITDEKAWLARIAWRVAVKSRKRTGELSLDEPHKQAAIAQLRSQLVSAEEFRLGDEMAALLESLISSLPSKLRDVLTLFAAQELTFAEIAEVLGITESSVGSRIFRAREMLREKLSAALEGRHER